jgi:hypothetical protein
MERCKRRFELAAGLGLKSLVTNGEGRDFFVNFLVFIYEKLGLDQICVG